MGALPRDTGRKTMTDHDAEIILKDPGAMRGHGPTGKMFVWRWTDGRPTMSPEEQETYEALVEEAAERHDRSELEHNDVIAKVWLDDESNATNVDWCYMGNDSNLTFDGDVQGYPTSHAPVIRDDEDVLVYAKRSKNVDSEWEIRGYRVLGDDISFHAQDVDRANVAAILVEEYDPDDLTVDDEKRSSHPLKYGVPTAVAVDGKPAIAAWLYVRGSDQEEIAESMDVSKRTVVEYLSRFRSRGTGVPDNIDAPSVGEIVPEVPPELNPQYEKISSENFLEGMSNREMEAGD